VQPAIGIAAACSNERGRPLRREVSLHAAQVFGKRPAAAAEHLVAWLKPRHVVADRLDLPCDVDARNGVLRPAKTLAQADDVREASQHVPVVGIDRSRSDPNEHAVLTDGGLFELFKLQITGRGRTRG
jgi:hypothetical protein